MEMTETIEQKLSRLAVKYPELAVRKAVEWGRFHRRFKNPKKRIPFEKGIDLLLNPSPYLIDNPDLASGDNPLNDL